MPCPCHACLPCLPFLHRDALPCIAIYSNVAVGCHPQSDYLYYWVLAVQPTPGQPSTQWYSWYFCTRTRTSVL